MENKSELKRLEEKKIRSKIYSSNQISWRKGKRESDSGNI